MKTVILANLDDVRAHILRDVLQNEGIESFTKNENMSRIYPGVLPFQIEVEVFEKDYSRAMEIFKGAFPDLAKE